MSKYEQGGVHPRYPTKKALKEAAKAGVPFTLQSTSMFGGYNGPVTELPVGITFNVVGPDPYSKRDWFASVRRTADGTVTVK